MRPGLRGIRLASPEAMDDLRLSDRIDALARIEPASLPLLSVYLNTDANETGRTTHETFVRKELRQRAKTYAERSPDRESLERDRQRIEQYLSEELKPSTRGAALFACAGAGLFEAIQLQVPFGENRLVVSDRPHLYPLVRLDEEHPRYAALVVDTNSARIFVFGTGAIIDTVDVQNPKTKHIKAGGWSQARFQRHVENVHLHHAKEVVDRLDHIVAAESIEHVVVAGDEVIVPLLKEQLPERLRTRLVDVVRLDIRSPEHEVLAATLEALRKKDEETDEAVVRDLIDDYRAGGLALVGAEPVREALAHGQVDTLVLAALPAQGPGADAAANDLVTLAKQTSASVRFIENPALLAEVGGVGASLRYLR
jgi:peptide chain release factor subunit 1